MNIRIDPEFKSLIPPLTEEEFSQLENNIIKDGLRDSVVVWNEILIDGHNRHQIAKKHKLILPFHNVDFRDRDEAKAWIIKNQFGRRNLSAFQRAELALKLEPLIAKKAKENQGHRSDLDQISDRSSKRTNQELSKIAGVSHDTIHKVRTITKEATEETKLDLRDGKISINAAYNQVKPRDPFQLSDEDWRLANTRTLLNF